MIFDLTDNSVLAQENDSSSENGVTDLVFDTGLFLLILVNFPVTGVTVFLTVLVLSFW